MAVPLSNHWYDDEAVEVSVTLLPAQMAAGFSGLIVGTAGKGFTTTTVAFDVAEQLLPLIVVTV